MGRNAAQNLEMRARTREKLLDAALSVLSSRAYQSVKIQDIARRARVAKGLFYEHFHNKEDVARHVALQVGDEICREILGRLKDEMFTDPHSIFQAAYDAYFDVIERNRQLAMFFVKEGRGLGVGLGRIIQSMFDRVEKLALSQFERGLKAGLIRTSLHYGMLSRAITGLLEQATHYYLLHPEMSRREAVRTLVEFSIGGVAQPQGVIA